MFGFLKSKLKEAVSGISQKIEEEGKKEEKEEVKETKPSAEELVEETKEKKGFFSKLKEKFSKKKEEELEEIPEEEFKEVPVEEIERKKEEDKIKKKIQEEGDKAAERIIEKLEKKEVPEIQDLVAKKKADKIKESPEEKPKEGISEKPKKEPGALKEVIKAKEDVKKAIKEEKTPKPVPSAPEEKGFFAKIKEKIVTTQIDEKQFNDLFWQLEIILLENNVAVEVIEKIKEDLKKNIVNKPIKRGQVEDTISTVLKDTIGELLDIEKKDIIEQIKSKEKKPFIICFVGINGSGKTTTIAKFAKMLLDKKISVVLAAGDTFRAAAIDQLQKHGDKLGIKVIKHDYGSDAAAVAFDAIKHAEAKNIDAVLVDTAGRMHSNVNLMDELKKIIRVAKPDMKIFIGESITGNDCVEQAKSFNDEVGIDGIILSKADIDEKGGAAVSVSHVTGKPILFIGTGQEYSDLKPFEPKIVLESLGL